MKMASTAKFIPSEEIDTLLSGSYEKLSSRVDEAIKKDAHRLFGEDLAIKVAGTFSGYAIVMSEDLAKAFRVRFEESKSGQVMPISSEPLNLHSYSQDEFVRREAKAFVENFFSGARFEAGERFGRLVPLITEPPVKAEPQRVLESFETQLNADCGWKRVYAEKTAQIHKAVGDDLAALNRNRLQPKFRQLYSGSLAESQIPNYEGLVTSDLKYLSDSVERLLTTAESSVAAAKKACTSKKLAEDQNVKMFESFSADYIADVFGVKKSLEESSNVLNRVDHLGKIYDVLADHLYRYEVAGRFIQSMSRRLSEASTEEG